MLSEQIYKGEKIMVNCDDCAQEMNNSKTTTCTAKYLIAKYPDGTIKTWERKSGFLRPTGDRCGDCNIEHKPGTVHHFGCSLEFCPSCSGQLISCKCWEKCDLYVNDKPQLPEGAD